PMAFTEQGVAMLSSILKSKVAIKINISIIRVFTKMRELFYTHKKTLKKLKELQLKDIEQDEQIQIIFEVLRKLEHAKQEEFDFKNRRRIGFKRQD
ncbi:MAG: ORF6N domain-containing protein, partial [Bacteroidales bacterium]|nr:ORF6N domain-containing protein [Bacteroidales bacterium]